ncbi:hypothetical protein HQ520_11940 [bacterium]|nr:hypothetical protein [bacterium]
MLRHLKLIFFSIFLLALPCGFLQAEPRPGRFAYSSGDEIRGNISTTPGKDLKAYVDKKPRSFPLEQVRSIRFHPKIEELIRKYAFKEFGSEEKVYTGKPYPHREIEAVVELADGQTLRGRLATTVLYIETDGVVRKEVIQYKQDGKEGQAFEDLVYVTEVVFEGETAESRRPTRLRFVAPRFGGVDAITTHPQFAVPVDAEVEALTRGTLRPVKIGRSAEPGVFEVESPEDEKLYIAIRSGKRVLVGWPKAKSADEKERRKQEALYERTRQALEDQPVFFDVRRLEAVCIGGEGFEVHALVTLARKQAQYWAGQPWQLAIWRWKFDSDYNQMYYDGQAILLREAKLPSNHLPEIILSDEVWRMERQGEEWGVGEDTVRPLTSP